jgi:hypothetical protein
MAYDFDLEAIGRPRKGKNLYGVQGVAGSNPAVPTRISKAGSVKDSAFFILPLPHHF